MDTKSKVIFGVLAGAAAGALLGVLFAPDKGSETRKKIAESGTDLSGMCKEKLNEFLASLKENWKEKSDEKQAQSV